MPRRWRVLVVDDEPKVLATLEDQLTAFGYGVRAVVDPSRAAALLSRRLIDVAVLDLGAQGLRLAREATSRNIPCILISGRMAVIEMGGLGEVLLKPFTAEALARRVEQALVACREPGGADAPLPEHPAGERLRPPTDGRSSGVA
jgi:two-component system KDP operon response regulator KdpE